MLRHKGRDLGTLWYGHTLYLVVWTLISHIVFLGLRVVSMQISARSTGRELVVRIPARRYVSLSWVAVQLWSGDVPCDAYISKDCA